MSRILLSVALLVFLTTTLAEAKGTAGIRYTPHNMSVSSGNLVSSTNEDEICIFCHTPHGGSLDGPLWNRDMTGFIGKSYTHYNSASLAAAVGSSTRAVNPESLLCLSCHDGSVAPNQIMNVSNDLPAPGLPAGDPVANPINSGFDGQVGPKIGASPANLTATNDLSDDHPISFSYDAVFTEYSSSPKAGQLKDVNSAKTAGVKFFGSGNRLECSSCHDPHVDYGDFWSGSPNVDDPAYTQYRPFLIMPNTGSAMCLACHNK